MQLQIFKYEGENHLDNLTTAEIDGEVWFVASEVCRLLDIKNSSDAVSRLDDDEKLTSVLPISGQNRSVNLVSESGLYALIFKRFQSWSFLYLTNCNMRIHRFFPSKAFASLCILATKVLL